MRLLHTADWHLGQTFHDFDRTVEHRCVLDEVLGLLEREAIDVLLIAGDLFDNANPPAAAQRAFYRFLAAAKQRVPWLRTIVIAGNHDSPGRLEAPAPLFAAFDVSAVGAVRREALDRLAVPLKNRAGQIAAWCLAVPFVRPGDVPRVATAGDAYLDGVAAIYRQALEHALRQRTPDQAIIALGHGHLRGGLVSADSERRLTIGGAEALPVELFDPAIAYVALGHLHRAQAIGGQTRVRYSGSLLPLSFAERDYRHQVVLVELDGAALREVRPLFLDRPVALLNVPERPAPPDEVLDRLRALTLPNAPPERHPYLQARVVLHGPEPGLRARIEAAVAGKPVRLVKIETVYGNQAADVAAAPRSLDDLARLQPDDLFVRWHERRYGAAPSADLMGAFRELWLTTTSAPDRDMENAR